MIEPQEDQSTMLEALLIALVQITHILAGGRSVLIIYADVRELQWVSSHLNELSIPTVLWKAGPVFPTTLFSQHLFRSVLLMGPLSDDVNHTLHHVVQHHSHNDFVWIHASQPPHLDPRSTSQFWAHMEYPQKAIAVKLMNESGCVEFIIPTTEVTVGHGGCGQPIEFDVKLAKRQWNNVGGRTLTATTVDRGLAQGITKKNGIARGHGMVFDILNLMSAPYNFSYNPIVSPDNFYGTRLENGSWDGMMKQIIAKEAHVTAAVFQTTEERSHVVQFSAPIFDEVMMILQRRPAADRSGEGIYKPFTTQVWLLLLATVVVVALAAFALNTTQRCVAPMPSNSIMKLSDCLWEIIRLLFSQAGNSTSISVTSGRVVMTAWGIFTVIVTSMYTANLTAFLTIPKFNIKIQRLKDLQSKIPTPYTSLLPDLISGHGFAVSSDKEATELVLKKGYVYLQKETTVESIILDGLKSSGECRFAVGVERFYRSPTSMAFPKGSPYKHLVDDFVVELRSYGISDYIYSLYYPTGSDACQLRTSTNDDIQPITIQSFDYTYIILGVGLALALVVMLIERLCTRAAQVKHSTASAKPRAFIVRP